MQTDANGCKWIQMDANGYKWMQMDTNGCKRMQTDANGYKLNIFETGLKQSRQMEFVVGFLKKLLWLETGTFSCGKIPIRTTQIRFIFHRSQQITI